MKTTYETCQPAGELDYFVDPTDEQSRQWYAAAVADGAVEVRVGVLRWCNAHIAPWGTKECRKAAITVDTEHPMYGTPATLAYPQDRYPMVVVGGSSTSSFLIVAPVDESAFQGEMNAAAGNHNGFPVHRREFSRDECVAHAQPERAFRINRRRDGTYTGYVKLGVAVYRRDWSD